MFKSLVKRYILLFASLLEVEKKFISKDNTTTTYYYKKEFKFYVPWRDLNHEPQVSDAIAFPTGLSQLVL